MTILQMNTVFAEAFRKAGRYGGVRLLNAYHYWVTDGKPKRNYRLGFCKSEHRDNSVHVLVSCHPVRAR